MTQPLVALENLVFRWRKDLPPCLNIEAFEISSGEKIFLQGASGSGKSTLLSVIGGVAVPEQGRVSFLGRDMASMRPAARDRYRGEHLGFIFQMFNLLPYLSALDNIMLPCRFSPRRSARIADNGGTPRSEALRLASHLDLETELLNRQASALSVGQQQRVAAARALIGSPELIVADEPTSALDADRQRGFLDLLLKECAAAGAAILFVSHDARLAGEFDRVVALADISCKDAKGAS